MTAVTVAAQGHGIAGRTKTCACASTKGEGVTHERWSMISHRSSVGRAALDQRPQSPTCDLDVTDYRLGHPDLCLAGEGRGRRRLHADPHLDVDS